MADYNSLKVPDLKKLLSERALHLSGNKADLIARLQEDDNSKKVATGAAASATPVAAAADDEIDWDEDDATTAAAKATTAAASAAIAAGGQGPIETPLAVPNQIQDLDPAATTDLTVAGGAAAPASAEGVVAASGAATEPAPVKAEEVEAAAEAQAEPQVPKIDFSIGIGLTDAQREAAKRIARAKRFGATAGEADEEERKRAERVKKFGGEAEAVDVRGIDEALPERKKRVREGREGREQGGREAKRQTPDRRAEPVKRQERPPPVPRQGGKQAAGAQPKRVTRSVLDDPVEKAKAEARAKKFGAPAPAAST